MRALGRLALVAAVLATTLFVGGASLAVPGCAEPAAGGDWASYGRDLSNTRSQTDETTIGPDEVLGLTPQWKFSVAGAGGLGNFQSTPTIADGCVYAGTNLGDVVAINADTGALVWRTALGASGLANGIFAVTVANGKVYANVSITAGPYAIALDQATGAEVWRSEPLDTQAGAWLNSSAVVFGDLMLVGFSAAEGNENERGGFSLLDANTGEVLKKTYPIPDADFAQGQGGGGVWATAVVDQETGYAYTGTSNPYTRKYEHRHTNALIKIDVDQSRPTFGQIVDAYKGDIEQYYPPLAVLTNTPACQAEEIPGSIDYPQCGQVDIDFGASPNMFTDSNGAQLVGDLQKSGVYHAAYTDTMQKAWATVVGTPCALCNAATAAVDDDGVYVLGTLGGLLASLDKTTGAYRWITPVGDGVHYEAVSVANGVVYVNDTRGILGAYDAATGLPMLLRPMAVDAVDACISLAGGAAIARNKVYGVCDTAATGTSWIIAYGLS